MPTGYTAKLHDGDPQTFPEFVMECARAFGALVTLRDSPGTPIPDEFQPSTYHRDALRKAMDGLENLNTWDDDIAELEADHSHKRALNAWRSTQESTARIRERYEAMLAEVREWTPPTSDHDGLKDFMVQQLEESIRFDASSWPEPVRLSAEEYREEQRAKFDRDVAYHLKHQLVGEQRAEERTAWVRSLRESLVTAASSDNPEENQCPSPSQ